MDPDRIRGLFSFIIALIILVLGRAPSILPNDGVDQVQFVVVLGQGLLSRRCQLK
jgi:hypothetical protein